MSCSLGWGGYPFTRATSGTGEPIAEWTTIGLAKADGASQPVLYVEFRKDGAPVDPGPWGAVTEGQEVRGL